jgi:hypothetical protein
MGKLRAVKPEILKPEKPKFLLSGPYGCGKTFLASGFPKPYYFDHEGSAKREQYRKRLIEQGGAYFGKKEGSQDYKTVIEEVKSLATEKHDFLSVIFDSTSMLENMEAAIAEEKVGNDFGRDKKEAYRYTRQLLRWVERLDMAVIFIAHQKDKWGGTGSDRGVIGTTYDGYEKIEGVLDLWLEMTATPQKRICTVRKSRIESMKQGSIINAEYLEIAKLYGGTEIIEQQPKPIVVATAEQISIVNDIMKKFNINKTDDDVQKWLNKVNADTFEDAPSSSVQKWIDYYNGKGEK